MITRPSVRRPELRFVLPADYAEIRRTIYDKVRRSVFNVDVNAYLELVQRLLGSEGIEETDDVFVVDEFHEFELAISSLRVRNILKGTREFFNGAVLTGDGVVGSAHDALTDTKARGRMKEGMGKAKRSITTTNSIINVNHANYM